MDKATRKAQIVEFHTQFRNLVKASPDPDTKRDLDVALNLFRNRYCHTFDQKKAAIIALLKSGATTYQELKDESGYRKEAIYKVLSELTAEKKIQATIYPMSGSGRQTKKYFLLD